MALRYSSLKHKQFYQELKEPIPYKDTLIIGLFPYHTSTVIGKGVTSHIRDEFEDLEEILALNGLYPDNKYTIVLQDYVVYLHDGHARKGKINNALGYDREPLMTKKEYRKLYKSKDYPDNVYKNRKEFMQERRKEWMIFRQYLNSEDSVYAGSFYYPKEVFQWLQDFKKIDDIMKKWYKNA